MTKKITVQNLEVTTFHKNKEDYISLTDIAKRKNVEFPADVIKNWMRNRYTIEFLGLWEQVNGNTNFKLVEFDQFKNNAGANSFVLSPKKWTATTNAIGIFSKSGRYGGTFAHKDIAFEFASWISAEFKLYLIKEFQRLKEEENSQKNLNWNAKRLLTKMNYKIHTDSIAEHIIPNLINAEQSKFVYANEADILNMALFGQTAKQWQEQNPKKKGNIRDYTDIRQLVCLANLESLNAEFIRQKLTQGERLRRLNQIAIIQMQSLLGSAALKHLEQ